MRKIEEKLLYGSTGSRGTQRLASLITFFLKNLKIIMNKELEGAQRVHIRHLQVNFTAL